MAKTRLNRRAAKPATKRTKRSAKRSSKRPKAAATRRSAKRRSKPPTRVRPARTAKAARPRRDRGRRLLRETHSQTPPSSLDLNRHSSAARSGRHELAARLAKHTEATPTLAAGDVDVDLGNAYFSGDETPGGDNPTPDQEVVDDIGKALGVQYADDEELRGSDKIAERDKHRWEMDPASSDDYRDRD